MKILDAALDIDLKEFGSWGEPERLVTNVHAVYQELNPAMKPLNAVKLCGLMSDYNQLAGNQ